MQQEILDDCGEGNWEYSSPQMCAALAAASSYASEALETILSTR